AETAQAIRAARSEREATALPAEIAALVASRERARAARDWATADHLRREIVERGWRIEDTAAGSRLLPRRDAAAAERVRG
ncbi:MAG: CysS/YqeB C-terminal domain-containing protein, partial [Candidatus Limnocylindria bacterium]